MRRTLTIVSLAYALVVSSAALAKGAPNVMHPAFRVLDAASVPVTESGAPPSSDRTCGACHDVVFIDAHGSHTRGGREASCVECHVDGSRLPTDPAAFDEHGLLTRDAIRISAPRDENCAHCHGIVHGGDAPLMIPDDFERATSPRTYALTLQTGEIVSPRDVSESWLNIAGKGARSYPWDVHSQRLVGCTACHFAPNNPARAAVEHTALDFLVSDPRRISLAQFLHRPDHDLVTASCRSCHDPMAVHAFLPYAKRHMDTLDCRACHIATLAGPAAQSVDATVVLPGGGPRIALRGVRRSDDEPLSAAFMEGYEPFLLPRKDPAGGTKLAPFNVVTRWFWASASTGEEVSGDRVAAAFLDGGDYAAVVVAALDANSDGRLTRAELRLDAPDKVEAIRARLVAVGVLDPEIRATVTPHPVNHGVQGGEGVRRDCASCHALSSVLDARIALSSAIPGGVVPELPGGDVLRGAITTTADGGLVFEREPAASLYVFGHSRHAAIDRIGLLLALFVTLGVAVHSWLRLRARRRGGVTHPPGRRVRLYSTYERIWHWLMAFSVIALMLTGLAIHTGGAWLSGLPNAVKIHDFFAIVLIVNGALSLFYHLASSGIRRFVPPREDLASQVAAQARYYLRGIFAGHPHPTPKSPERRLNPLQQLTYLGLLNLLFPLQAGTGILIWGASRWPDLAASMGGLTVVAPLHAVGSWLLLTFLILHLYLTTTGRTVLSNVRAMVDGFEEIDEHNVVSLSDRTRPDGDSDEPRVAKGGSR